MSTPLPQTASVARKHRRAGRGEHRPRASRAPFAGGVAWIVVVGVLLAGIVAVNVLVLQLNMQFDGLSRERAQLKADNALLRSQLSSASASVRIEEAATVEARPPGRRPADDDLRAARQVNASERPAARTTGSACCSPPSRSSSSSRSPAPRGCRARSTIGSRRWRSPSIARRSRSRPGAARSTTAPASRSRSASRRRRSTPTRATSSTPQRAAVVAGKALGLDADELYPDAQGPVEGLRLRRPQGRPEQGGGAEQAGDPRARLLPRGAARVSAGRRRRRTCSASPAPTTTASTGSSARSTRRCRAGPASRRSSRIRSAARSTSSPRRPERPGKQRDADDRSPDPGERRADPRADREAVRRPRRRPRS